MRELVILALVAAVVIWPFSRVFSRAGYSPWFGLVMVIPLVNLIALWMFAYAKWPALQGQAKP
jgi:hypothetical protein